MKAHLNLGNDAAASSMSANKSQWDEWNLIWRFRQDHDQFKGRQRDVAVAVAREIGRGMRILDVGCGTGWLGHELLPFGRVWGTDLSADAIADGALRYSELTLICGDFFGVELPGPFDLVVSADAFVHMPDHEAFLRPIAGLLKPGRNVSSHDPESRYLASPISDPSGSGIHSSCPARGMAVPRPHPQAPADFIRYRSSHLVGPAPAIEASSGGWRTDTFGAGWAACLAGHAGVRCSSGRGSVVSWSLWPGEPESRSINPRGAFPWLQRHVSTSFSMSPGSHPR